MTFDEMLAAIQGFLGGEVVVTIGAANDPWTLVGIRGVLERGEASLAQPVMDALGYGTPGDEALQFHIAPDTQLTFRRAAMRDAGWLADDRRFLRIDQSGVTISHAADYRAMIEATGRRLSG